MPRLFIRVELHYAVDETYEKLHSYMAGINWYRVAPARVKSGVIEDTKLPSAMYTGISDYAALDIAEALTSAIRAEVWKYPTVLVMITDSKWGIAGEEIA